MKKWQTQLIALTNFRNQYQTGKKLPEDMEFFTMVLDRVFRYITNKKPVKYVSEAAKTEANRLGIDLTKMTWDNQNSVDPHRQIFHYEHCIPIKQLRLLVLETNVSIKKIIDMDFVCWTLKTESKALDKKYKDFRKNWKKCFSEFNIKPILNK